MFKSKINPYSTLGVGKDATAADIKKAYRELSKLHHPDRTGGTSDAFNKVTEAYDILSDPAKRREFDSLSFDPWLSFVVGVAGNAQQGYGRVNLDLRLSIEIPIYVAFNGGSIKIEYVKNSFQGGSVKGQKVSTSIVIPKRSSHGFIIKVPGEGNYDDKAKGDLYVVISYPQKGKNYSIDQFGNIRCSIGVSWARTLTGSTLDFAPFESGESVKLKLDPNAKWKHVYTLKGQGMSPIRMLSKGEHHLGNLILEVISILPANMTEEDKKSVLEILTKYEPTLEL